MAETKPEAEALVSLFQLQRVLNQDQNGRRIALLGKISDQPALISLERAAFPTDQSTIITLLTSLTNTSNLGANDVYRWYLASTTTSPTSPPSLKLNLIYPCTPQHIKKYSPQRVHTVTETPQIYHAHIRPYIASCRSSGRLNWVFNILDGLAEQDDIILYSGKNTPEGFLLAPDLNWDRTTLPSLHLLAIVSRDIWSLRDLTKRHIPWLTTMREKILDATISAYPALERDDLKLYVHYQPTYYHFHIHVVHVMLESGATQAVGKAFGLENLIAQLEVMGGSEHRGMADVSITYTIGEAGELWEKVWGVLKDGKTPVIAQEE